MKVSVFIVALAGVIGLAMGSSRLVREAYRDEVGHCEPLTLEFMASLVTLGARHILDPSTRPRHRNLRFDLYTRLNPHKRQELHAGDFKSLRKSNFNTAWPVRFSFHGWNGLTSTCSNAAIKDAYLKRGNYNVILVDWSAYALEINYLQLVFEVREIAAKFNKFTRFLSGATGTRFQDMYLIGHSLGSHVAGMAGKLLKPDKYGVIISLDASGPIHNSLDKSWRLSPNDALYVESIHTDTMVLGFDSAGLGHASFYPNWGMGQPHCPNATAMEPEFACDHFSSLYYFAESVVRDKAFGAVKCKNYRSIIDQKCGCGQQRCPVQAYMGGDPVVPKRGVFYVSTRENKPFGNGDICPMKRALKPTVTRL